MLGLRGGGLLLLVVAAAQQEDLLHIEANPERVTLTLGEHSSYVDLTTGLPVMALASAHKVCLELGIGVESVDKVAATISSAINGQQTATQSGYSRTRLLSLLVKKFSFTRYLEIGCRDDHNFAPMKKLGLQHTACVDPTEGGTHRMTSDKFFAQNTDTFDLVFVDGMHEANQALRDVNNALRFLNPRGVIVMHDCNPLTEHAAAFPIRKLKTGDGLGSWNGDVWRAVVALRTRPDLDVITGDFDQGCAIVRRASSTVTAVLPVLLLSLGLEYSDLRQHRRFLLDLRTFPAVLSWLGIDETTETTSLDNSQPPVQPVLPAHVAALSLQFETTVMVDQQEQLLQWSSCIMNSPQALRQVVDQFISRHELATFADDRATAEAGMAEQLLARMGEVQSQSRLALFFDPSFQTPSQSCATQAPGSLR